MCFVQNTELAKDKKPLITKSNLVCYKEVYKRNNVYTSLYYHYKYELNKTTPKVELVCHDSSTHVLVREGYHSFTPWTRRTKSIGGRDINGHHTIMIKCIIPKGTKYYYSPEYQEYVSERIKPIEEV